MSNKNTIVGLITFMFLVNSQGAFMAVSAQHQESAPNANERTFQEAVSARTGFPIFDEELKDLKRIEHLLTKNIRLEIKSDALARAAAYGDVELLQLLLSRGANVNHMDSQGKTVLMLAAAGGFHVQCGNDPLVTSYRGNAEEVKSLLAAGARSNEVDHEGNTALMLAAQNARSDSVKLLLNGATDVHVKNKHGWTALMYAANSSGTFDSVNMKEIVEALIAGGSDLNERDLQGKTALTHAAHSPTITAMLICAGAIE